MKYTAEQLLEVLSPNTQKMLTSEQITPESLIQGIESPLSNAEKRLNDARTLEYAHNMVIRAPLMLSKVLNADIERAFLHQVPKLDYFNDVDTIHSVRFEMHRLEDNPKIKFFVNFHLKELGGKIRSWIPELSYRGSAASEIEDYTEVAKTLNDIFMSRPRFKYAPCLIKHGKNTLTPNEGDDVSVQELIDLMVGYFNELKSIRVTMSRFHFHVYDIENNTTKAMFRISPNSNFAVNAPSPEEE